MQSCVITLDCEILLLSLLWAASRHSALYQSGDYCAGRPERISSGIHFKWSQMVLSRHNLDPGQDKSSVIQQL